MMMAPNCSQRRLLVGVLLVVGCCLAISDVVFGAPNPVGKHAASQTTDCTFVKSVMQIIDLTAELQKVTHTEAKVKEITKELVKNFNVVLEAPQGKHHDKAVESIKKQLEPLKSMANKDDLSEHINKFVEENSATLLELAKKCPFLNQLGVAMDEFKTLANPNGGKCPFVEAVDDVTKLVLQLSTSSSSAESKSITAELNSAIEHVLGSLKPEDAYHGDAETKKDAEELIEMLKALKAYLKTYVASGYKVDNLKQDLGNKWSMEKKTCPYKSMAEMKLEATQGGCPFKVKAIELRDIVHRLAQLAKDRKKFDHNVEEDTKAIITAIDILLNMDISEVTVTTNHSIEEKKLAENSNHALKVIRNSLMNPHGVDMNKLHEILKEGNIKEAPKVNAPQKDEGGCPTLDNISHAVDLIVDQMNHTHVKEGHEHHSIVIAGATHLFNLAQNCKSHLLTDPNSVLSRTATFVAGAVGSKLSSLSSSVSSWCPYLGRRSATKALEGAKLT